MHRSYLALCLSLSLSLTALGAKAEAVGPVYPIAEQDMLQAIQDFLKEKERRGELAKLQEEAIARSRNSILNPAPVAGLRRTTKERSYYYDPTLLVNQDVTTPDGYKIAKKGDRLNPLDKVSMSSMLVFFDARDQEQVAKAKAIIDRANGRAKPVLVGGSLELRRIWRQNVYYDQAGLLTKKFGIQQTPALVYQEGKKLRVDEILVEGGR